MAAKRKPTGFVARCACGCGVFVAAMDYTRTPNPGKMLGEWLMDGCTVEPRFGGSWSVNVESCRAATDTGEG